MAQRLLWSASFIVAALSAGSASATGRYHMYMSARQKAGNGIDFTLIPAPDEEVPQDLEQQQELMRRMPVKVPDTVRSGQLGQGYIGDLQASAGDVVTYGIHSALSALPTLGAAFAAWIGARGGRKVRVKVGEIEVEAGTAAEASALLQQAAKKE